MRAGRAPGDRDIEEELEAHLAHRIDDLVAEGVSAEEARARALDEFGDPERIGARCREVRRRTEPPRWKGRLDLVRQDLSFAFRQLARHPGFASVAVLTLALGVAATATVLGVVQAVVLDPLPFAEPDRLVYVEEVTPTGQTFSVSEPAYLDWRERSGSFAELGASTGRGATLQGRGEPRSVRVGRASASLLPTLGVEPLLGRGFADAEDRPGAAAPVAILGHALWRELFGADRGVLGEDAVLDGRSYRIVGVLPGGLPWLDEADLLVPLGADPAMDRDNSHLDVWGRLAPDVTLASARAEMAALAEELGRLHPVDAGWGTRLSPARALLVGEDVTRAGWVLLGAAVLLLVIACVNVANLLLARASARRGELAVRRALGAGRARIVRQLFVESGVLALAGGGLGLLATILTFPLVRALGGGRVPRLDQAGPGSGALAGCLLAVAFATVVFGLAPALGASRNGPAGRLRAGRGSEGPAGSGLQRGLVVGQVALSVVLLIGTGLLVRSFTRLASVDPGFDAAGTLTARLNMPDGSVSPDERAVLLPEILDALEAVPGVEGAGATAVDPFSGQNLMSFVARHDRMPADAREFTAISWRPVTAGLVEAMGIELREGRSFLDSDGLADESPVMIGASLADRLWPEGEAVGSTLVWGDPEGTRMTVVGVVEDVNDWRLALEPFPMVYRAYREIPWSVMTVVVRARGEPTALADDLRGAIRRAAPGLAVPEIRSLGWNVRRATAEPRFQALLAGVFAVAGLALALVGVYGVTAFAVSRRRREMGIRLTLGGDPSALTRMVLLQSGRLAVIGALLGAFGAWWIARALTSLLYETEPGDPVTWGTVTVLVVTTTLLAAWIPSRRATQVDPREVMGAE